MINSLVVVNPKSGKTEIRSFLFSLLSSLSSSGRRLEVLLLDKEHKIEYFLEEKDEVICCGGDGTLNSVINAIIKKKKENEIRIGYIPCGSTNDFARSLGVPLNLQDAANAIIKGTEKQVDVGLWNKEKIFSYVASFGAFTDVSYSTPQELKNNLGHFAYVLNGVTALGNIKDINVKLKADNISIEDNYCFGAILNSTSVAGMVKLKKSQVDMCDGFFEILLIKKPKNFIELNGLITSLSSASLSSPLITFIKCKKCKFKFEKEIDWSLDGEKEEGKKVVEIENLKKRINIILPQEG